jgi:hypothetical protein
MQITVRQLTRMIVEAARREQPPRELMALVGRMPMKVEQRDSDTWIATARFSEKKRAEQARMDRGWERVMAMVSKRPWVRGDSDYSGWNGQTDTGGNYSSSTMKFTHKPTGLTVSLSRSNSFRTGTKEWSIYAVPTSVDG